MVKRWVATEHEDDSTCDPCEAIDGKLYTTRMEAYADYPGGVGYVNCVGAKFGNSCRGRIVKRRSSNAATYGISNGGDGMTDERLLTEFRARLTERRAINARRTAWMPEQPPVAGKSWYRITNAQPEEACIRIMDDIGRWGVSAQSLVDELDQISAPKIRVEINSGGGDVFDGIAIHTALAQHPAHVTTFITGLAASAASYIAMAGDLIKMARNATMMIHDASSLVWGNATAMRAEADLLDKLSLNIADMYALQAGGTPEEWFARMENTETWYTGREALAAGLVDEITDPDQEEETGVSPAPENRRSNSVPEQQETELEESPETDPELEDETPDLEDGELLLNSSKDVGDTMLAFLAERIRASR